LRLSNAPGWTAKDAPAAGRVRRGAASAAPDPLLAELAATGRVKVVHALELEPPRERRAGSVAPLQLEADTPANKRHIAMVRHASGAISFHVPAEASVRGARRTLRFTIPTSHPLPDERPEDVRRSGLGDAIKDGVKTVLLEVGGKIAEKFVPKLALKAEQFWWKKFRDLKEGWKDTSNLTVEKLPPADLSKISRTQRNLLLLHGTFSHTVSAFAALPVTSGSDGRTFMDFARSVYGDRIFGFDHFTVSKSPIDNVRELLSALPVGPFEFDVVTHSRGGLVLRTLVELSASLGSGAKKFQLGRAALVASPNEGTPLASRQRLNLLLNWIANVMDMAQALGFANPFVMGTLFLADGLSWLADHVLPELAGLESMDSGGQFIRNIQSGPGPTVTAYSALVSSFQPDGNILRRMIDAGVDGFFGSANDLVVPSEGGWRIDFSAGKFIPGDRIGCFAPDGNIQPANVTHINFFSQRATVDFLRRALAGEAQGLTLIDPVAHLHFGLRRGMAAGAIEGGPPVPRALPAPAPKEIAAPSAPLIRAARPSTETLYLTIINVDTKKHSATLVASFRNATLVQEIQLAGGSAGQAYFKIVGLNRSIRDYVNGVSQKEPPKGQKLIEIGGDIFSRLFPGDIQRLYDAARAAQANSRLNVILTSDHTWVADLPYEFAHDPVRDTFLSTSEVNFTRNIITSVPADGRGVHPPPLRMLVIVAQPLGLAHLSGDQEQEAIRSGFKGLIDAGLATVEVHNNATPESTLRVLERCEPFDVVHFIGHGLFQEEKDGAVKVGLVFQDAGGRAQIVNSQQAQKLFCRRGIRLMFLNACETSREGKATRVGSSVFNRGVAQELVKGGIPTVVANQFSVLDVSATTFARHFYWSLANGSAIGDAARESRISVDLSIPDENIDWAVPVVFTRDPEERLIETGPVRVDAAIAAAAIQRRREVRRLAGPRKNWGLWDVQGILPNLDDFVDALNGCQDQIEFTAVRFSAPLGTWRRQKADRSPDKAYLDGPEVVERLNAKPRELGLYHLIAITNLPLKEGNKLGLRFYAKPRDYVKRKHPPEEGGISIVSTETYQNEFQTPQFTPERLIANSIADVIGQLYAHDDAGRKLQKDCPQYENPSGLIQYAAGRLQLCEYCRDRLKKLKRADRIPLIENILQAL
ncbi:MAG TPA: CHAT domain-containing protein, partial [Candidatus Solibacter sp.]|nr:CHAT domain-containing protein [Candidatus Solibacter sp.]